jgi:outer membrane protein OmpA-like peptidoglycan-associated protein
MRKLNLLLFLAFYLQFASLIAQNRTFPNAIHAKLNAIDYGLVSGNDLKIGQGFEFAYVRNIAPALNIGLPIKLGLAKLPETTGNTLLGSADLVFRLENIRATSKIVPFAFGGAGYVLEKFKDGHAQFPFGAGVHFRVGPYSFLSLQAEYRKALVENRDNIHIGFGFVYMLHPSEAKPQMISAPDPNDTDRDGINNEVDKCPNDPGPAITLGCPDRDNDGVSDAEDSCPDEAGTLDTEGCPDYDKDGLADKDDECPTEAGSFNGCPDTDYDGVPDKNDKCKTEPGPMSNMGCPENVKDSDSDGFDDSKDQCPDMAGPLNGCPDGDNDGVADVEDKCPGVAGLSSNFGCPEAAADSDGDGISDDSDPCPNSAGSAQGCPDADGDGIADKDDKCPEKAGSSNNMGCPEVKAPADTDGDGLADKDDPCPDQAGSANGCPDADGDGLADKDDLCPEKAGPLNGCPDTDGDGLADKDDPCPKKAGSVNGCPDGDGDGVADKDDPCPNKAGNLNGCPDGDGDGIADKDDKCPNEAGSSPTGCPEAVSSPDSDGDGVADDVDKCPSTAGPRSNRGCPEVKQESKDRLVYAARAVQFETAKAILKDQSYSILDEIVAIMRENPAYTLSISGYTDDLGSDERNLELSRERAKACYDYLVFRGIKTERLRHAGFGEARPVADNSTVEGRELNRRVEFELVLE